MGSRGLTTWPEKIVELSSCPRSTTKYWSPFEHGDVNHPLIVGFLWNGVDTPPETTNQNRVIKTPGGHQLRFEDKNGEKKVILKSNGGHQIEIDDAAETVTIKTNSGNQFVVLNDANKSTTVRGGGRLIEMANGKIQMS